LAMVPYINAHSPRAAIYSLEDDLDSRHTGKAVAVPKSQKESKKFEPLVFGKFLAAAFKAALKPSR